MRTSCYLHMFISDRLQDLFLCVCVYVYAILKLGDCYFAVYSVLQKGHSVDTAWNRWSAIKVCILWEKNVNVMVYRITFSHI